ncbi:MAG: lycopene cyclase domain-containing protein [Saprospiraceae bacterium]|nr:lycopene cyclase domain-containing protein [Saprospiraceae bacterium]
MDFLETKYLYLGLMVFTIMFPLVRSFEHRLVYYKRIKYILPATLAMMAIFIPWDVWFTEIGVWWFRDDYITGARLFGLPLEEWAFFVCVPFACLFIYEAIRYYVRKDILGGVAHYIFYAFAAILLVFAIIYNDRIYPLVTFSLTGIACFLLAYFRPVWIGRFLLMYLVSWLPFLLVNGVLTGNFTETPIVNYNPIHHIGTRITTIPVEDSVYSMLMLLTVVVIYEWSLKRLKVSF